ncbi:MAG: hypothetical protein ACFHU9_04780 [Fluviicola sp.]
MNKNTLKYPKASLMLALMLFGFCRIATAQYMEFEWSDEQRFTNKRTGFFEEYLGTSHTSIYLLQRNISKSKPYDNAKLKLVSMNKHTLLKDTVLALKGFPENESNAEELKDLDYLKTVVTEEGVFVFWRKLFTTDTTRHEEIYAQSFRSSLKAALPIRKVFEFEYNVRHDASIFDPSRCVVLSSQELENMVVGMEIFDGEKLSFRYVTIDSKLVSSSEKSFVLPHKLEGLPKATLCQYDLRKNGMIYAKSVVMYTNRELEGKEPDHPTSFPSLTVADMSSGNSYHFAARGEDKTISDFSYQNVGGKTRVIGFFGDLALDTTGIDDQGVFYADIDDASLTSSGIQFVYFDRSTKNRIMSKKDRQKREKELSKEEILESRFDIEHIEPMPDSSLVVFFTLEYNTQETTSRSDLNGRNVYSTYYNYKKTNVYALRFSDDATFEWARSFERNASYAGQDKEDIQVVFKHDDFFVMFGNENPKLKAHRKKKLRHLKLELEYAKVDPNTGRDKIYEVEVNEPRTMLKDLNYIDPSTCVAIDDNFYFHQIKVRQNPLWTAANVVFFPTLYYTVLTGNTMLGNGNFAIMKVMEGKKPRRRN